MLPIVTASLELF